jgi:hypothetical protein
MRHYRRNADEDARRRERARAAEPTQESIDRVVLDKLRAGRPGEITLYELQRVSAGLIPREVLLEIPARIARSSGHLPAFEAVYTDEDMSYPAVLSTNLTLQGAVNSCIESALERINDYEEADIDAIERMFSEHLFEEPMGLVRALTGTEFRTRATWISP